MSEGLRALLAIGSSIVGLSVLSVILSNRAQTTSVINAAGSAFSGLISAATAPVTGGASGISGAPLPNLGGWSQ